MAMPNSLQYYDEANDKITQLRNNPIFKNSESSDSFCLTMDAISNQVTNKKNQLENKIYLIAFLTSFILFTTYFLYSKDPQKPLSKPFVEGFILTSSAAILTASASLLTKYIEQPIKNVLCKFKFFNNEKINNASLEKPIHLKHPI